MTETKKEKPVFFIPTITKPPIFKTKKQLMTFFAQEEIARLRPLGKIIGFVKKSKPTSTQPVKQEESKEDVPKDKNTFWEMVGYKGPAEDAPKEEDNAEKHPNYEVPSQFMKSLTHTGTMKRIRMNKEKSDYRQIITPCPDYTVPPETKDTKKKIQAEKVP